MDDTLRHLLLALAETLDPSVLPVLADRLEELEDGRAGEVRALAHGRPARVGAAYNGWGSAEWDWRLSEQGKTDCRSALKLFPEGPRWQAEWFFGTVLHARSDPVFVTPAEAKEPDRLSTPASVRLFRLAGKLTVQAHGPFWPELTPPPPRH